MESTLKIIEFRDFYQNNYFFREQYCQISIETWFKLVTFSEIESKSLKNDQRIDIPLAQFCMGENKKSRVARVSDLKFSAFQPAAMDNHRPERLSAKKYSPYQPSSEKYFRALNESAKCAIVQTIKSRIPGCKVISRDFHGRARAPFSLSQLPEI